MSCADTGTGTDAIYWQIGRRIRSAREARGTTQEVLASWAHLTRGSIANIEAGRQRVTIHALLRMAAALDVQPATLLPDYASGPPSNIEALLAHGLRREDAEKIARLLR